jgi:hypothetical protein
MESFIILATLSLLCYSICPFYYIFLCRDYVVIIELLVALPLLDSNTHHVTLLLISVYVYSECGGVLGFNCYITVTFSIYYYYVDLFVTSHV